jgi:hypothetical protein
MFDCHLDYFQKPRLGEAMYTKPGDHDGTQSAHNHWFILVYHVWRPTWIKIHWNSIQLRGPVTYDFTLHLRARDHTKWFWRCVGAAVGHFLLGSHNFMVTALGSCVKWPFGPPTLELGNLGIGVHERITQNPLAMCRMLTSKDGVT